MRPTRALAVAVLAAVLTLSACSSGDDSDDGGGGTSADDASREAPAAANEAGRQDPQDGVNPFDTGSRTDPDAGPQEPMTKKVISKGNVQLSSDDVEQAVFDVQSLVDEYAGEVTDRETNTDDEGEVRMARMVLRIPSKDFQAAFTDLEKIADLRKSTSTAEDVTTQVIDNQVRIRAQRRSLRRVEILLDRAQSIRDIVSIEAQLTRRQANLDSLEQQQAYLTDQTSLSTVTVNIQRTADEPTKKKDDDAGFLTGLEAGWNALVVFGTGLATLAGALLPWAVVLLILGGPLSLLVRRLRRRSGIVPDVPAPSASE